MDIHGISFDMYTWYKRDISMDIPRFLKADLSASSCCWSHSMHTRVRVIESVLFHTPPWQLCKGKRLHKRLNQTAANLTPLSLAAAVTAAAAEV